MKKEYEFTDLEGKKGLVEEIRRLEEKIGDAIGSEVNLIAYSPSGKEGNAHLEGSCRAGLED